MVKWPRGDWTYWSSHGGHLGSGKDALVDERGSYRQSWKESGGYAATSLAAESSTSLHKSAYKRRVQTKKQSDKERTDKEQNNEDWIRKEWNDDQTRHGHARSGHYLDAFSRYWSSLQRDSYTQLCFADAFKCEVRSHSQRVTATLPSMSAWRRNVTSEYATNIEDAKEDVARRLMHKLRGAQLLQDSPLRETKDSQTRRALISTGSPLHSDAGRPCSHNAWPARMRVIQLSVGSTETLRDERYGFLVPEESRPLQANGNDGVEARDFSLRLAWHGQDGVLRRGTVHFRPREVRWPPSNETHARAKDLTVRFHESVVSDTFPRLSPTEGETSCSRLEAPVYLVCLRRLEGTKSDSATEGLDIDVPEMEKLASCPREQNVMEAARSNILQALEALSSEEEETDSECDFIQRDAPDMFFDPPVHLSLIDTRSADFDAEPGHAPAWLASIMQRWLSIRDAHLLRASRIPMFFGLSPEMVEASFSTPSSKLRGAPSVALRLAGRAALRLLWCTAAYVRGPYISAGALEKCAKNMEENLFGKASPLNELASTIPLKLRGWTPPGVRCRRATSSSSENESSSEDNGVLEALCGAVGSQAMAGFFGLWQICCWHGNLSPHSTDVAVGHYLFGLRNKHAFRTPTYTELSERLALHENRRGLWVNYVEVGWVEYRRSSIADDVLDRMPGERAMGAIRWKVLSHDCVNGTFKTSWESSGTDFPLPSKVVDWLLGNPLASIVDPSLKHYPPKSLCVDLLRERLDGRLEVTFDNGYTATYRRVANDGVWYFFHFHFIFCAHK